MAAKLPETPRWVPWSLVVALAVLLLAGSMAPVSSTTGPAEADEVAVEVPLESDDEVLVSVPPEVGGVSLFALLHVLGYATLASLLAHVLSKGSRAGLHRSGPQLLVAAILLAVAYSVVIELLQGLVPYRTFSYADMALNTLGATLGVAGRTLVARLVA